MIARQSALQLMAWAWLAQVDLFAAAIAERLRREMRRANPTSIAALGLLLRGDAVNDDNRSPCIPGARNRF